MRRGLLRRYEEYIIREITALLNILGGLIVETVYCLLLIAAIFAITYLIALVI
ncbi:MAG: hypothetical protein ACE5PM_03595 [Candidatus Hydrothermarchaeales archaeon]